MGFPQELLTKAGVSQIVNVLGFVGQSFAAIRLCSCTEAASSNTPMDELGMVQCDFIYKDRL